MNKYLTKFDNETYVTEFLIAEQRNDNHLDVLSVKI